MDLFAFLTNSGNIPFAVSGVFLGMLLVVELIGVLAAGVGASHFLDMLDGKSHELHAGEFAADALGYLHWGKVPAIVLLSSLAGLFSLSGLGLQSLVQSLTGGMLPAWLASIPAGMAAVFGTHYLAKPLAKLMPSDTGDALKTSDLLGMVGMVTNGPVSPGSPGEARIRDLKGRIHLVRIQVTGEGQLAEVGDEIALTALNGPFYVAAPTKGLSAASVLAVAQVARGAMTQLPVAPADGAESKSSVPNHQEK